MWRTSAGTLILAAGLVAGTRLPSPWADWQPAACLPHGCFCEQVLTAALVRQPVNAVSALAFVAVALLVLLGARAAGRQARDRGRHNLLLARPLYSRLFAGSVAVAGLAAAFYHSSLTFMGKIVDVFGVFVVMSFVILYNVARIRPLPERVVAAAYIAGNLALLYVLMVAPHLRRSVFYVLLAAVLALELAVRLRRPVRHDNSLLVAALCTLALGAAVWWVGLSGPACSPAGWIQGHAIWHVFAAAAVGLIYAHYRTERPVRSGRDLLGA